MAHPTALIPSSPLPQRPLPPAWPGAGSAPPGDPKIPRRRTTCVQAQVLGVWRFCELMWIKRNNLIESTIIHPNKGGDISVIQLSIVTSIICLPYMVYVYFLLISSEPTKMVWDPSHPKISAPLSRFGATLRDNAQQSPQNFRSRRSLKLRRAWKRWWDEVQSGSLGEYGNKTGTSTYSKIYIVQLYTIIDYIQYICHFYPFFQCVIMICVSFSSYFLMLSGSPVSCLSLPRWSCNWRHLEEIVRNHSATCAKMRKQSHDEWSQLHPESQISQKQTHADSAITCMACVNLGDQCTPT